MKLSFFKMLRITLCFFIYCNLALGQNPIVTHIYTADPTARVFDGRLYVYPSHDVDVCNELQGSNGFCMPDYHMFSTEDMVNWKDHGVIMDQNEVPWGAKDQYGMWAPDCIYKDGTYYYYYPGVPADKSAFRRIGVATSKNPTGPFKQVDHYIKGIQGIDPGLFVDDDGKAYLYYGGGNGKGALKVVELKDNMVEIKGQPKDVEGIIYEGYREASFLFKRNDTYYFTYARIGKNNYQIEYATADNPMGPFEYKGIAMENIGNGTNHHSFVEYKGQWYLFYHDWSVSGNNRLRSMCADKMEFNEDGTIIPVKPTLRGIGTPKAGDIIQIDRHSGIEKAKVSTVEGNQPRGFQLHYIENNAWVKFDRVNFGDGTLQELKVRAASGSDGGTLELRTGTQDGPLLATVTIENTGSWKTWKTFAAKFTGTTKGIKDIVCVFKGKDPYLFNVNWIKFSAKDVPESDKILVYETEEAPAPSVKNKLSAEDLAKVPKKRGEGITKIGDIIQIDEHNGIEKARISPTQKPQPKGFQVGHINDKGWIKYDRVDFGEGNLKDFKAMVSAGERGGTLELRLDTKDGPILASIDIQNTGGWNKWKLMSVPFSKQTKGVKNIVCTFKGDGANLYNVNWIRITSSSVPNSLKEHPLEKGYTIVDSPQKKPKNIAVSNTKENSIVKAGDIIQIDKHSGIDNARITPTEGDQPPGNQVGYINDGGWLKYEGVDFGKGKLKTMKAMVSSAASQEGILEIRIDSLTGPVLTSIKIPNTGGWKSWKVVSAPITGKTKGIKDIYCLFKGNGKNLYNLNWLRFSSDHVSSSKKPHPLEKVKSVNTSTPSGNIETPKDRARRLRDIAKGKKIGVPLGQIVAIKSGVGKYLSVQGENITASADTVGEQERFAILSVRENIVAIKSMATNKLFSARLNQDGIPVIASHKGEPKDWEKFTWQKIGDIQFTLKANNSELVQVNDNNQNSLTAGKGSKLSIKAILAFEIIK
ncbi:carbohydrate-binding protein [Aquimarina algiphila]|uniref:carbohydrate-binding protein n=1 Tax=Aquimarina algiphila TaxID=2047982 RepID=UPI00248F4BC8|nr:carbohydrate-binding protein [Aquimarina algiphila]